MDKLLVVLFFVITDVLNISTGSVDNHTFSHEDFLNVIAVHDAFCTTRGTCANSTYQESVDTNNDNWVNKTITMFAQWFEELPVSPPSSPSMYCCKPCSCDPTWCIPRGSCCLGDRLPRVDESLSKVLITCVPLRLRHDLDPNVSKSVKYAMYSFCHREYQLSGEILQEHKHIVDKCENSVNYEDLDTKVPVTVTGGQYVFKNRYCAYCNYVTEERLVHFQLIIECSDEIFVPSGLNTLVSDITRTNSCNLVYRWPSISDIDKSVHVCYSDIAECNVTGLWVKYDAMMEASCHAYRSRYFQKYANVFCYMCNTGDTNAPRCSTTMKKSIPPDVFPSFSTLLKFTPDQVDDKNTKTAKRKICSADEVYDELTNICRVLTCMTPRTLVNGTCISLFEKVRGVSYAVYLHLSPNDTDVTYSTTDAVFFTAKITKEPTLARETNVLCDEDLISYSVKKEADSILNHFNRVLFTTGNVGIYNIYISDIYQSIMLNNPKLTFVLHYEVNIEEYEGVNTSLVDTLLDSHLTTVTISGSVLETYKVELDTFELLIVNGLYDYLQKPGTANIYSAIYPRRLRLINPLQINPLQPVILRPQDICPLVTVDTSEFTIHDRHCGIYIDDLHAKLVPNEFYRHENYDITKHYSICLAKFLALIDRQTRVQYINAEDGTVTTTLAIAKGILALICTCLSLLCLLLTLIVYIWIQELRTQPGINNMVLSASLFCAQVLFQFASGQAKNIPKWICQVIGVFVHFSWLHAIFWMNICSFHMFRSFTALKTSTNNTSTLKQTLLYELYSIVLSAVPVSINIAVLYTATAGDEMGYGEGICYISRYYMVGYTFTLPVFIVVFINIVLFLIVVVKITRMPSVQSSCTHNRSYMTIYAKLSSLTGITWLLGFVYVSTEIEAIEYLFIIPNAGQGVFIFVAFVCNKRVLRLLITSNRRRTGTTSTRATSISNTGHVSNISYLT